MAYIEGLRPVRSRKLRLNLTDFSGGMNKTADSSVLPMRYAVSTYNYACGKGILGTGLGIQPYVSVPLESGNSVASTFLYQRYDREKGERDDRLLIFTSNGKVYEKPAGSSGVRIVSGFYIYGKPACVNYRLNSEDVVLIFTPGESIRVYDGAQYYKLDSSPKFVSSAVHSERVFGIEAGEKSTLWFSDDLDPLNWGVSEEDAGYIEMVDERGPLERVVSFQNYVYVFRQRGISRVAAFGGQSEFSVSHLYVSGGYIFPNSICVCGDRILFLAEEGLCMFDGAAVYRLQKELPGIVRSAAYSVAAYCKGKYYVAFDMDFGDGRRIGCEDEYYLNSTVMCYDIATGDAEFLRGVDVCAMSAGRDESYHGEIVAAAVRGGNRIGIFSNCGAVFGVATHKRWDTPESSLGYPEKDKMVKRVYIRSDHDCRLEIRGDGTERKYDIKGAEGIQCIQVSVSGRLISMSFVSDTAKAMICQPAVDIVIMGGGGA